MIKVGTSGFSFEDWKGTIYPAGLPQKEMLSFYEKELGFNVLEVNFTYYTLPSQKSFEAMSKKTSKAFEFVVKAFKGMTHEIRDKETGQMIDNQETFKRFKFSLVPLIGEFILLFILLADSQQGNNQYGPNPKNLGMAQGGYPPQYAPPYPAQYPPPQGAFCPRCGGQIPPGAGFCQNCGTRLR